MADGFSEPKDLAEWIQDAGDNAHDPGAAGDERRPAMLDSDDTQASSSAGSSIFRFSVQSNTEVGGIDKADEQSFQRILQLLRAISGLDWRQYNPETLRSRITQRMILLSKGSMAEYYRFLQLRPVEVRVLEEDLLINLTRFFRDPNFWDSVRKELTSADEEIRSAKKEVVTIKGELQSTTQELQILRAELQDRKNASSKTGNDVTNLLNSMNIPLLMLTSDLRIRQFTPPMERLLSVRAADVDRSITEIRLQLSIEDITPILNDVLETLAPRELQVQDREGRWRLLRVRPYRTTDNRIEGLVVVLLDIDQLRSSQQHLLDAHHFSRSVVESVPVPIVVVNDDCAIRTTNTAFRELTQIPASELEGRSLPDLAQLLWGVETLREQLNALLASALPKLELEHESKTPQRKTLLIRGQVLKTEGDQVLLLMIEDITMRREAERLITQQKAALENEVEITADALTRTKEELRSLAAHLFTVQEEERERVARELHDDVSQRLSLIEILLTAIQPGSVAPGSAEKLDSARKQLQTLNADVRQISHRLHPAILKDLGLPAALRSFVEEFERREGMPATFMTDSLPESWPEAAATTLYRITQEALRNVSKHAGRTHVKVLLHGTGDALELRVMDFGMGFDQEAEPDRNSLGLISMQERARIAGGTFSIKSALGQGTTVTVRIPLE